MIAALKRRFGKALPVNPNWEAELWALCWADRPFQWGKFDCGLFVADAVQVITGTDIARGMRETYSTETAAKRLILANGGGTVRFTSGMLRGVARRIDPRAREIPADTLEAGDVVVMDLPGGLTGGVHTGGTRIAFQGHDGVTFLFNPDIVAAWRVNGLD